jgi:DNA-binding transcriptional regulator LsrR (DeoR family)
MTNYLNPSQKINAKFVTLHGDIACCENELDVRTLVSRISKAFAGEKYYLLSEALTSSAKVADIVKNERNNRKVFEMFNNINISIAGVGSFYPESTSVLSLPEFMPPEDLKELKNNNVVGDIAMHFFDKSGNECKTDLSKRVISIGFEQYKKLDKKIVIASGAAKAYTLYCALKGGLADVIIIDYQLADILCSLWNKELAIGKRI